MHNPTNLTHVELATIVSDIQNRLYLDIVEDKDVYDPEKVWNVGDIAMDIGDLFSRHGLAPESRGDEMAVPVSPSSPRIVIVIHDTVVQGAYCSDPDAELIVVDWDVQRCDPFMDGTVVVPGSEGETHHADIYHLTAIPLEQFAGTHSHTALQRAGMSDEVLCHSVEVVVPESLHPHPAM